MPSGAYLLVASTGKNFKNKRDNMAFTYFYVSNISYVSAGGNRYFVLDRETGEPMQNVSVKALAQKYDSKTGKPYYDTTDNVTTNEKGLFRLGKTTSERSYYYCQFLFAAKTDTLYIRDPSYMRNEEEDEDKKQKETAYFFTDRGIYRPGQNLFFKAIAIAKPPKGNSFLYLTKDSITVYLEDANRQVVDSVKCKQNEYASITGQFVLPQNTLTGNFSLTTNQLDGQANFKVEEYKRPTFSVMLNKPKGSYRLNDTITVTGFAKAFAGSAIDGEQVKYSVTRRTSYFYGYRGGYNGGNTMEIKQGTVTTDAAGNFTIQFLALPDVAVEKASKPTFNYSIEASITEKGGETRQANSNVSVGYQPLKLQVYLHGIDIADSFRRIPVSTTNFAGNNEAANVHITISPLKTINKVMRARLWERADQFVMDRKQYETDFPYDDYSDDSNRDNWAVGKAIVETDFLTNVVNLMGVSLFNLAKKLPAGYYKIDASVKDKSGEDIRITKYVQLFSRGGLSFPQNNFTYTLNGTVEPKQTTTIFAGTSHEQITVLQQTQRAKDKSRYNNYGNNNSLYSDVSIINRKKGLSTINYTATEADRGGLGIQEIFVKHNRVYTNQYNINVPWSNKNLNIQYATYRDKTEPGSKEQWTVTVKDIKGGKVAGELLATMYDASLDQFAPNGLAIPYIWGQTDLYYNSFAGGQGFTNVSSTGNYVNYKSWSYYKRYDYLLNPQNINRYRYLLAAPQGKKMFDNDPSDGLDDVVVVGYGNVKRKDITGAVSSINPKAMMASREVASFDQALQGRVAGVSMDDLNPVRGNNFKKVGAGDRKENIMISGISSLDAANKPLYVIDGVVATCENPLESIDPADIVSIEVLKDATAAMAYGAKGANGVVKITTKAWKLKNTPIIPRTNFSETAFFFPQLHADTAGNYTFSFTMPDALTQWRWLSFAHTKELQFGIADATITSQKTLMVQSNAPRFVREGDKMEFSSKISNLSDKELTGQASLELIDATTNTPVDGWFQNAFPNQYFTVAPGQSTAVKFPISIPYSFNKPLLWKVVARAGNYSDGEEKIIPVVSNRQLVTESLPILVKGDTTVHLTFDKLLSNNGGSQSLTNESLTVECMPNPVWYAVQALPYLMEYPYECAEQTFNRFYANALAASIIAKHPRIKAVFEQWAKDTTALQSNLYKNQELKQILLEETPWVLAAQNQTQQKKNIALLYDMVKMASSTASALEKLKQMQFDHGGFPWFKGGREDRYITNYILTGIGKLKKAGALSPELDDKLSGLITKGLSYLDGLITADYQWLIDNKRPMDANHLSSTQIQYLYMRSFYDGQTLANKTAHDYYYKQGKEYWVKQNFYHQALLGSVFSRNREGSFTLKNILPSISENAIHNQLGMYWKDGYTSNWYQSPIEYQAAMIGFFDEMNQQKSSPALAENIADMKTWLILNKQTNNWKTTVATSDACYALLSGGDDLLSQNKTMTVKLGNLQLSTYEKGAEAGSGYFKQRIDGDKVVPEMGNIMVTTATSSQATSPQPLSKGEGQSRTKAAISISYGAVYWQYFEDMDKITPAASPLSIHKKLFIERNSDKGKVLTPVNDNDEMKIGDKVIIRLELRSDRDMEYLHLKDLRAATMEPENVLSSYKWQDGLGYYEATKDASTNFFISNLQKGTYIFEYPVYITHTGTFSTGTASIQCMYALEFTSHSEGMRVRVEK
ncbi:alpha-2-macroglobulin family protein [Parasediminibacterium sp. JCM 36343]|uniref:alpha-2-macroglobulin family protein n=1 Tax=Parasediminibacterium sp. JCM 36343 TaxID=3374279 RepID=UPI0039799687